MAFDFEFLPSPTTVDNLRILSINQSIVTEQRICELSELADTVSVALQELFSSGMTPTELFSYASDGILAVDDIAHSEAMTQHNDILHRFLSFSGIYDKAIFSELLVRSLGQRGIPVGESDFLPEKRGGQVFAFVKNQYSDEAFEVFSESFSDPRVSYCTSFSETVKKINSGLANFCLLPLEERGGVRLPTVSELILSSDLKINAVTPVFGYTGTGEIKYAMVSKNFIIEDYTDEDDRYLEVRLENDSGSAITELGIAASAFGLDIYRINNFTAVTDDGVGGYYSAVFRNTGESFVYFLAFLSLFCQGCTTVGLYKNLE